MAKNYIICSGQTPVNYSIDMINTNNWTCAFNGDEQTTWEFGVDTTQRFIPYTITATPAVPSPLTTRYRLTYTLNQYMNYEIYISHTIYQDYTYDFTFGQSSHIFQYPNTDIWPCYKTVGYVSGAGTYNEWILESVEILNQSPVPQCVPPPPECSLSIANTSATDPSQRGASDGTISANINVDGNPDWYIDEVLDPGNLSGHTFTGLEAGTYYIKAVSGSCYDVEAVVVGEGEFKSGDFTFISPTSNGNIVAVENPILLTLGTAINNANPDYSINTFTVTGSISNVVIDFAITFPYNYEAEFRSKGYPDRTNYFLETILKNQVGTTVGNNTNEEIATSLGEAIQNDPILSRIYYITTSGTVVTMIAKEFGNVYDLDATNVTITGSNLVLANTTPGVAEFDGQLVPDYSLYAELLVNEIMEYGAPVVIDDYRKVTELNLPFSQDNVHQFNVAPTLKNFVSTSKIPFTITGVTFIAGMIASYFIKYGEKYPLVTGSNTKKKRSKGETDKGWCINSALNFEDPNRMNDYFGSANVKFLNTAPDTKYSCRGGKEFYSITIPQNYTYPLALYGNIYNYDGTSSMNVFFFDITTGSNFGGVAVLACGYNDLGLSAYESVSKIRKVDIQVMQNNGGWIGYSEVKSFLFDVDEQPSNYNVAFLNKLGTYETYPFIGELIDAQDVNRNLYQRPYQLNSNGAASLGFEYNTTIDTEYTKNATVNTGIIDAATFDYLMGLLQSNKIFHYDDVHQSYLNIVSQTATRSSNTNEYSVQIVFKETISENNVNA
jgi:uncharacterized membrane protein